MIIERVKDLEMIVDYLVNDSKYIESDDIGFNGQLHRKKIFQDLIKSIDFDAIVETGTFDGSTSGYMASVSNLPIYTCELNEKILQIAKMRLANITNVHYYLGDSREFLSTLAESKISHRNILFYLDAHWNDDLPLMEEIKIINKAWQDFVILIDDFEVPGDAGYQFHDYGPRNSLTMREFYAFFSDNDLDCFLPSLPSTEETGKKRGCIVLVRKNEFSDRLERIKSLKMV